MNTIHWTLRHTSHSWAVRYWLLSCSISFLSCKMRCNFVHSITHECDTYTTQSKIGRACLLTLELNPAEWARTLCRLQSYKALKALQCMLGMRSASTSVHHAVKKWGKTSIAHRNPDLESLIHHQTTNGKAGMSNVNFMCIYTVYLLSNPTSNLSQAARCPCNPSTHLTASCCCYLNVSLFWLCNRPD